MNKKKFKKMLAFVVTFAMILSISVPAFADQHEMTAANKLEHIGVLLGAGDGVTDEYLAMATTRAQGAVVLLRLMGREDEAKAFAGTVNFEDVVGNEWYAPYTAYLKANPELGFVGYPDGTFRPNNIITGAEMVKVLLTALGFMQDEDYTWAEVEEFAAELGLTAIVDGSAPLDNNTMAEAIWEVLNVTKKDDTVTLAQFLIAEGVISAADADYVGLITDLAIVRAEATNDDEITVWFNQSVEEDTDAVVKTGFITVFTTQTWNEDRTKLTFKKTTPFAATTYQVIVGDLDPVDVTVSAAVPTTVVIEGDTILIDDEATISVKLYNQYGKAMSITRPQFSVTAFNQTSAARQVIVSGAEFKIDTSNANENDIITVTVMHNASTLVAQANLTAIEESKVHQFALTGVVMPEDQEMIFVGDEDVEITYTAYDQYGNEMKVTQAIADASLTFVSSATNRLDVGDIAFDADGKMTFEAGAAGTVNLSVLVNATGAVASMPITIYAPSAVDTVTILGPDDLVVSGESTELVYSIADQFGAVLDNKANRAAVIADLKFVSNRNDIVESSELWVDGDGDFVIDEDGVLTVTPSGTASGTALIYYYFKGALIDSFALEVNPAAEAVAVQGVDTNEGMELDAEQVLKASDIKVIDQYGRAFTGLKTNDFVVTMSPEDLIDVIASTDDDWTLKANDEDQGTVTFTVGIWTGDYVDEDPNEDKIVKTDSEYQFTIKVMDVDDLDHGVTYSIKDIPVLYSNAGFDDATIAGPYAKAVVLEGVDKDGRIITLVDGKIAQLTSDNPTKIAVESSEWKVYAKGGVDAEATLRAYDANAKKLAEIDVESSKERSAQKVAFGADFTTTSGAIEGFGGKVISADDPLANFDLFGLNVTDEYGVNMLTTVTTPSAFDLFANGFFTSSNTAAFKIVKVNGNWETVVTTPGSFTLTYTTNCGMQDSVTVTMEDVD